MLDDLDEAQTGEAGPSRDDAGADGKLLRRLKRWERLARSHWSGWRKEAQLAYDFVAGKQWSSEDKATLLDQMRQPVTFNRVAPMVDAVTGAEILNRQEVRYLPREQGDVQVNELITAADEWARELADTEDEESDAFADVVICGMGWSETRMDYSEDAEGRIVDDRVDPLEMWSDSTAKKRCVADARYLIRARWRDREDLPEKWKKKLPMVTEGGSGNIDERDQGHTGPRDDYEREDDPASKERSDPDKRQVWIRHFQWFEKEPAWRVADPMSGQAITLDKKQLKQLGEMFLSQGQRPPKAVKIEQNKYYQAFVAGNTILEGPEPIEANAFTFKCITGKRDRNANTFYGVVRAMIDPQMWGNKFFVQIMHILNTSAKGGLLYEAGSFENPRKALEDWSRPDAAIELKSGSLRGQNPSVQERTPAVFPVGTEKMMEFALNNLPQTSGINLELLGLVEREQPGVLEAQRKKAGYAILAVFFDSLRRYRKMKGRLRLYFIQNYISDGRLIRIKGKDSTQQYVPLVKDKDAATYDVIVDEAPMSPNQKETTWAMMQAMMPMLAKLNVPPEVWSIMLEYSPLPSSVSAKINEAINKQAEQPPPPDPEMEKAKAQMQIAQQEAQLDAQTEQGKAQLEREKMQAELQMEREKHEMDKQAQMFDLQVQREKAQLQMQGELAKLEMQGRQAQQALTTQVAKDEQAVEAARAKAAVAAKPKPQAKAA